jgi:hypothetical protein
VQTIPLQAVPSQTLSLTLNGQAVGISLYTMNDAGGILGGSGFTADTTEITADTTDVTADETSGFFPLSLQPNQQLYIDVTLDGDAIITAKLCTVLQPLLLTSPYIGFEGELEFFDTLNTGLQDSTNPVYTGLGTQYQLVYFSPADLAAS